MPQSIQPPIRRLIIAMFAAGLACRLAFVFLTPIFQAPDEEEHFNYIRKLAVERAFPVMAGMGGGPAKDWEYEQPPLYYLALAPVYGAAHAAGLTVAATVRLLRLGSVLLWIPNLWLASVLLRRLQVNDAFVWVFTMGMLSLLPSYVFISSAISNDNLSATIGGALFCLIAAPGVSLKRAIGLGLLLGLALLTKKSALVFLPAIGMLPVLKAWRAGAGWRVALASAILPAALAVVIFAPWAWRDWHVYGTFSPEMLAAPRKVWPSPIYGIGSAIHNLIKTFWAVSGETNNVGYPCPLPGEFLLVLACVPMRWWRKNRPPIMPLFSEESAPAQFVSLLAASLAVVLVVRFGFLLGMGQGRHLFSVLYPLALLLAWRLQRLPVPRLECWAAGYWLVYALPFLAYSLARLR